jgi:hypothetical protein
LPGNIPECLEKRFSLKLLNGIIAARGVKFAGGGAK